MENRNVETMVDLALEFSELNCMPEDGIEVSVPTNLEAGTMVDSRDERKTPEVEERTTEKSEALVERDVDLAAIGVDPGRRLSQTSVHIPVCKVLYTSKLNKF